MVARSVLLRHPASTSAGNADVRRLFRLTVLILPIIRSMRHVQPFRRKPFRNIRLQQILMLPNSDVQRAESSMSLQNAVEMNSPEMFSDLSAIKTYRLAMLFRLLINLIFAELNGVPHSAVRSSKTKHFSLLLMNDAREMNRDFLQAMLIQAWEHRLQFR